MNLRRFADDLLSLVGMSGVASCQPVRVEVDGRVREVVGVSYDGSGVTILVGEG